MLEKTFNANGQRIKAERKARNLTQQDLAEAVGFNKRTIENAEADKRIKEHFLQKIAKALEISFQDVVIPDHSELSGAVQSNPPEGSKSFKLSESLPANERFKLFGFGGRSEAIDVLMRWQKHFKTKKARVICFTGHTLDSTFLRILDAGVESLEMFMGSKQMARRLDSRRQEELFDLWLASHLSDFHRHIDEGRLSIRYYDCPPSFTGIALDNVVYLINNYIWMPTLNWLNDVAPHEYMAHWESLNVPHRPRVDDYTLNGCDMPSMLVAQGYEGPAGVPFDAIAHSFEMLWKSLQQDLGRPPESSRKYYKPFEEMVLLQERLMDDERRKVVVGRSNVKKPRN